MPLVNLAIYLELLPWELLFMLGLLILALVPLSLVVRALRTGRKRRPTLRLALLLVGLALVITPLATIEGFSGRLNALNTNRVATAPDHVEQALRTRRYSADPLEVRAALLRAIDNQRGWQLVASEDESDEIKVDIGVPSLLGIFTDSMVITLSPSEDGGTYVDVSSHSLVGGGDLGENRRHVLQLFYALREELP